MKDSRIDQYISNAEAYAIPILQHLRTLIHQAIPEIEETIKWSMPHFTLNGKIVCSIAAFKKHCVLRFWNGGETDDPKGLLKQIGKTSMSDIGKINQLSDLPSDDILTAYIKTAAVVENVRKKTKVIGGKILEIPDYFKDALNGAEKAKATFDNFSYSNKKEYIEWLVSAKTEPTRLKRLKTSIEWLSEGKIRNWKYVK